jgi:hypothetical protein
VRTAAWTATAVIAATTAISKGIGPFVMARLTPSTRFATWSRLATPALLGALVAVETFAPTGRMSFNPAIIGVAAGGAVYLARKSLILAMITAAAVTALIQL